MHKPFDASLNALIDSRPGDWAAYLAAAAGIPAGPAEVLDTDLSATLQCDRLFRIAGPRPALLHLELESTGRLGIPEELLRYSVAARKPGGPPVHSVVVLLRPKANPSDLTGRLEVPDANGDPYHTFRYTVVRLWREPLDGLLAAGPAVAPLALLTDEAAADLPAAVGRLQRRLRADGLPDNVRDELLGYATIFGGLRYDREQVRRLVMGGKGVLMESSVIQWAIEVGEAAGRQKMLLEQAQDRFGPPTEAADAAVRAIEDVGRLQRMGKRMLAAAGWDDLLATP